MSSRVVAITGASSGVGRATAREFARTGATVGLLARGQDGLEACADEVRSLGGRPIVLSCDVAEPDQVSTAAERLESEHGPIDVWVNNAMATVFGEAQTITAEEYLRVTEVTYLGVVYGTLTALCTMLPRDRGVIVQVGSALAYRGIPLQSAYCAAKHAIQGFTESLRCELLHQSSGVRVTMVQLPALNTPQFEVVRARVSHHPRPVAPIYQPEVAARAILAAAEHPDRREWWVGGSTALSVIGNAIAPGVGDRYLARTGYEAQLAEDKIPPDRPDNLFGPVPGDRGSRGRFSEESTGRSAQWSLTRHRRLAGAGLAGALAATAARIKLSGR
ncbi:MAG TPA: SDR family oxidoreductase [Solirubrobacteraceae bacterium]|jgi:NAD(P)-dependent dehydrogenase (short-subunit alcohol dehydrogenase family)|nr:SDR family oxidoreductase [Solirubrobacteraceae bacterium]